MMGRSHVLSGSAGWYAACAAATLAGHAPRPTVAVVGGVVAAGAALWPDIDHPGSTVTRVGGTLTAALSAAVAGLARWARLSCRHCHGRQAGGGGHRMLTHTVLFAVLLGVAFGVAGWRWGAAVGVPVVWAATALTVRSLLRRRTRGTWGAILIGGVVAAGAYGTVDWWWWVGVAAGWGILAHSLGDAVTEWGAPLWWPVRIRGCRWARVGTPRWSRFTTGGGVEMVVRGLMLVTSVAGLGVVVFTG